MHTYIHTYIHTVYTYVHTVYHPVHEYKEYTQSTYSQHSVLSSRDSSEVQPTASSSQPLPDHIVSVDRSFTYTCTYKDTCACVAEKSWAMLSVYCFVLGIEYD